MSRIEKEAGNTNGLTGALLDFLTFEDVTNRLSRNVGKELPLLVE